MASCLYCSPFVHRVIAPSSISLSHSNLKAIERELRKSVNYCHRNILKSGTCGYRVIINRETLNVKRTFYLPKINEEEIPIT